MNLKNIAGTLRTHANYIFYDKLNYAIALPLSAVTATQFYLGRPAYGVRDVLLSLILLDVIGMHRESKQELRQAEEIFNPEQIFEETSPIFNEKIGQLTSSLDATLERASKGRREFLKN